MKNRMFFILIGLITAFLIEAAVLIGFALPKAENAQDTTAVNEAVHTVQRDWDSLEDHTNHTALAYVVLDMDGTVLYRTKSGLSESINAAVRHKDTILDIPDMETDRLPVGKIIIYNNDAAVLQSKKQAAAAVMSAVIFLQCCICAGYCFYIQHIVINPFHKMEKFAERIAGGSLDLPLTMDRHNLFGAFTESFDMMRCELKKARMAEAKADADKKELIAKLSHDIKTPVASIRAASEAGAALSYDERNRKNYEQIIQKADQINTLVTDLFSAALEELQEFSVTPSDLKSEELRTILENADYLHRAVIPPVPACLLFADRLRLQQVFDNIFANSYKYADTDIKVAIRIEGGCLAVSIEDYGGGADESELPLLKEKFKRGSNTKNIEGAGLGLYISDYCIKQMQGRLDIENGSTGLRADIRILLFTTQECA